jgi:hypothetical protein
VDVTAGVVSVADVPVAGSVGAGITVAVDAGVVAA